MCAACQCAVLLCSSTSQLLENANQEIPEEKQINLQLSIGWITRFYARKGQKFRGIRKEGASAGVEGAANALLSLRAYLAKVREGINGKLKSSECSIECLRAGSCVRLERRV